MPAAAVVLAVLSSVSAVAVWWARTDPVILGAPLAERRSSPRWRQRLARVGSLPVIRGRTLSGRSAELLARSGIDWSPGEIVGLKVAAGALTMLVIAVPAGVVLTALLGAAAFRTPDIVIARAARRRRSVADREIPVLLDLLSVATSGGLPAQLAFRRSVEAAEGPLSDELRPVLNATDLGGRWRDELRTVSERLDLPDLRRLVGTLGRSDVLGSPLNEELARLAGDVRERRRAKATERARAAPVKMLFPLVFLVLPAFLLLTVVPVLVTTVRSIV
jgi:tight adherence protein C